MNSRYQNQDQQQNLQQTAFQSRAASPSPLRSHVNVSMMPHSTNAAATTHPVPLGAAPRSLPTVASIVTKVLLQKPETNQQQQRFLSFNYLHHLEKTALETISKLWADSTVENRRNLWTRFLDFTKANKLQVQDQHQMDWAIVMFLEHLKRLNPEILPSSLLTYAKNLAAIASRLTMVVPITRMYQSGLRASGALIPQAQAPPLPWRPHLEQLARKALAHQSRNQEDMLNLRLYSLLFIMVKTCSRFDEVQRLTRQQMKVLDDKELFIDWKDQTKSTRSDPNREDTKVVLRHDVGLPKELLEVLDKWRWNSLLPYNVTWFDKWMDLSLGELQGKNAAGTDIGRTKLKFSAHSIKAAVVTHLARCFKDGKLSGEQVSIMAKHSLQESSRMEGISRQTLRYIRDPVLVARMNGTDRTSAMIPWVISEAPPSQQ